MNQRANLYLGKAGQLAVMSEFLVRCWNVAMPEVDVGDDLFVVEDKKGIFYRIQVKTATAVERRNGFSTQFKLSLKQLSVAIEPEIYYIFVVRRRRNWQHFIVIKRRDLFNLLEKHSIGTLANDNLMLYFSFQNDKATCSNLDFSEFLNNFDDFPIIEH